MESIIASRVKLERFADEFGFFRMNGNAPVVAVIEIPSDLQLSFVHKVFVVV
jgi:hypothetical protein